MRNPNLGDRPKIVDGQTLAEVSRRIVQLHAEYYGRGPTKARSEWIGPNREYLICILTDCFTTVERTLVELGRLQEVRATRQVFQDAMADRFTKLVEEATGRRVVGFMSQASPAPEMVTEFFVLEPESSASEDDAGADAAPDSETAS
ncbi:MAG TPA: Na-translocating system protein MpsC family protein [Solirubrobacteraceae bacterium]|jgi:uncharacterized protein YbcI|nr:Na-translocating system protein MpsC family protein [Solirubrobacteraceae bacterium]